MRFDGYQCNECYAWLEAVYGYRLEDGTVSIKCPNCGHVEKIEQTKRVIA